MRKYLTGLLCPLAAIAAFPCLTGTLHAAGVMVGNSTLIGVLDYSDTFTGTADGGTNANRPYVAAVQPAPTYVIEKTYGHPSASFFSTGQAAGVASFSIASDTQGHVLPETPTFTGSGAGSATGFTQTGTGGDWGVPFGFRTNYIVQVDAVTVADRIDITSGTAPNIGSGLSVFFRGDGTGNASLYNGAVDTPIKSVIPTFSTGITGSGQWTNLAVRFDTVGKQLEIYVNQVSKGVIDLNTFAGGIYANFSNAVVGVGGSGGTQNRIWTDNFQVGAPVPEPGSALLGLSAFGLFVFRRKRK